MRLKLKPDNGYRFYSKRATVEGYYKSKYTVTYSINTQAYGYMSDQFTNSKMFIV